MWKVMKDLYTNVKAQVLYAGSLSGKIKTNSICSSNERYK